MSQELRRRRFIQILPLAGVGLLAACSDAPAPPPAPAPEPAPAPAPAPEPAPAPAAEPAAPVDTAAPGAMVDESDPTAQGLAYVADNSRVDRTRHANFSPDQNCANCALYQGAAGSAAGGCPLFAGRQVASTGWCTAWARKA